LPQEIIPAIITSVIAFFTVYVSTPFLIKGLEKRNFTVKDYNKKETTMVARPGGFSIIAGILTSEFVFYGLFQKNEILVVIITTFLEFIIGLIDDRNVMSGWFKPIALGAATIGVSFLV